jgi:predicted acetyltransferase
MFAQIRKATVDDRLVVRHQLKDYLNELSAFGSVEERYAYFDEYWKESTRSAYVVEVDGEPIGFIFINQWSPSGRGTDYSVAEFYIAPRWRGRRHGTGAAHQVFQRHPGQWELAVFNGNARALAFWPAAIMRANAVSYERVDGPDTTILRFVIVANDASSKP